MSVELSENDCETHENFTLELVDNLIFLTFFVNGLK